MPSLALTCRASWGEPLGLGALRACSLDLGGATTQRHGELRAVLVAIAGILGEHSIDEGVGTGRQLRTH